MVKLPTDVMTKISLHTVTSGRWVRESSKVVNVASALKDVLMDQAGRLRISMAEPLGDYKLLNDRLPQFFDTKTGGGATVEYSEEFKAHEIRTENVGDYAVVQTYQRHNYFAGKAQMVEFTSFNFHVEAGIIKRYGYFTSSFEAPYTEGRDGYWIEANPDGYFLVICRAGEEIARIPREKWDDPMDGLGYSGYTINWENFNVFQQNFLWLGGTGIRFYVVLGSDLLLFHEYVHVGSEKADGLIMASPNQPIRMEVRQIGEGSGLFRPVCSTVATEGSEGSASIGEIRSVDSGVSNAINVSHPNTVMVKGIRLKEGYEDVVVNVLDVDVFASTTNDFFRWRVLLNPTLSAPATWVDVDESPIQHTSGNGITVSGGVEVGSGYGASRSAIFASFKSARKMGVSIDGIRDEVFLTITPVQGSTNLNVFGALTYKALV